MKLIEDGLARKMETEHGASVYELTDLGRRTSDIIFELAVFGTRFQPEAAVVSPGNLRTEATTLGAAASRVATPEMDFDAAFVADGEPMHLKVQDGKSEMLYEEGPKPDLVFTTNYADLLSLSEGEIDPEVFAGNHSSLKVLSPGKDTDFITLKSRITALLREA